MNPEIMYTPKEKIPMFRLVCKNEDHYVELKNNRTSKLELVNVMFIFTKITDPKSWEHDNMVYSPREKIPIFKLVCKSGEYYIELKNPRTHCRELIRRIDFISMLINPKTWEVAEAC